MLRVLFVSVLCLCRVCVMRCVWANNWEVGFASPLPSRSCWVNHETWSSIVLCSKRSSEAGRWSDRPSAPRGEAYEEDRPRSARRRIEAREWRLGLEYCKFIHMRERERDLQARMQSRNWHQSRSRWSGDHCLHRSRRHLRATSCLHLTCTDWAASV